MAKAPKEKAPVALEVTQEPPTAAPVRDDNGFQRDQWGLPIVGPARIAMLAELDKPDPNDEPDAWAAGDEVHDLPVVIAAPDADEVVPLPPAPPLDPATGATANMNTSQEG